MPNKTFYLKREDVKDWEAIDNKSLWIHEHLRKDRIATKASVPVIPAIQPETLVEDPPAPAELTYELDA